MKIIFYTFLISLFLFSCNAKEGLMPNVSGKAGEILVIIDKPLKEGETGKLLTKHLQAEYPQLPQHEPLFDLIFIQSSAFSSLFQTYRNILHCNIDPYIDTFNIKFNTNIWAQPQYYMEINARNSNELYEIIKTNNKVITNFFINAEKERLINTYRKYRDRIIAQKISEKYNINIAIPKGYSIDKEESNFMWIANETQHTTQGIFLYKIENIIDNEKLNIELLIQKRDSVLKENVPGPTSGSWMTTEHEIPVIYEKIKVSNTECYELRGLWRVENDYMGGPFLMIAIPINDKWLIIDGFVYAPRNDKRTYIQQIEAIAHSIILNN